MSATHVRVRVLAAKRDRHHVIDGGAEGMRHPHVSRDFPAANATTPPIATKDYLALNMFHAAGPQPR